MHNYLAKPHSSHRGSILILHAWWGLNDFFKSFCNRLADQGYLALAPDLYQGELARTIPEAENLRNKHKRAVTSSMILEAMDILQQQPDLDKKPVGVIGFSLGGWWSLWLNEQRPDQIAATVLFYGSRGMKSINTRSAFLGHFAEHDPYESVSGIRRLEKTLKSAGKQVEFYTYPATKHWFFESDRPEYNPQASTLAWARTLDFLQIHMK